MTFASSFPDAADVLDPKIAAGVGDQSGALQGTGVFSHRGSSDPYHLGKVFLGEGKVAAREIVHPQQLFAHARFDPVQGVAGGGLLQLLVRSDQLRADETSAAV
jgi:hypothetical protein